MKKINKIGNYSLDEIKHKDLMNKKHKKVCRDLNCFEHFLDFISVVSGCVSISAFAAFVGVPVCIGRSAVGLKICVITSGITEYKSIIHKKRKNYRK